MLEFPQKLCNILSFIITLEHLIQKIPYILLALNSGYYVESPYNNELEILTID